MPLKSSTKDVAGQSILVIDVGGTSIKVLASGEAESKSFKSGPMLTPRRMVSDVKELTSDWTYDVVSIGYPGPVLRGQVIAEPHNLGRGWIGYDFTRAFGHPVKIINDAAMQALGSYKGGRMLFLGLGTGLGTAMIIDGLLEPMELGHLPYKKSTYEDNVRRAGLERDGEKEWRRHVADVVERLIAARWPDYTDWRRQYREAQSSPAGLSSRSKCQCVLWRFSTMATSRSYSIVSRQDSPSPQAKHLTKLGPGTPAALNRQVAPTITSF